MLGEEPEWVKIKRRYDIETEFLSEPRVWTDIEDKRLLKYLETRQYSYGELCRMLGRTSGAIQRRILDLNTPLRPIKSKAKGYSDDELSFIADGIRNGMSYILMANRLERSDKAIRGVVYNTYLTEDLDKVRQLMGSGRFGDGAPIPNVKQGVCLSRHRATVKKELSFLAGLLKKRANDLGYEPYWQRFMCKKWDDFKGCLAGCSDCDSCVEFERIKEQFYARCGNTFFERVQNKFCPGCRAARLKNARKKWRREHG